MKHHPGSRSIRSTSLVVRLLLLLVLPLAASIAATPSVTVILNNYSHTLPSSRDYGIAPGAIFVIYGADLADTTANLPGAAPSTSLSGVQVGLETNGGNADLARLYYVSPTQIIGLLPPAWPVGTSSLWVRNQGRQSPPVQFKVVASAFGILSQDGSGFGPALAYGRESKSLRLDNFSRPGDVISIYGSGIGAVPSDESAANLASIPMTAEIGGLPAPILYRGTIYPGFDQFHIQIPNLGHGELVCQVPFVIKTNGIASNTTTLPIAIGASACPVPASGNTDIAITDADIERWSQAGTYTSGNIILTRYTSPPHTIESHSGTFFRYTGSDIRRTFLGDPGYQPPVAGQCKIINPAPAPLPTPVPYSYTAMDIGPFLHMAGPNGTQTAHPTIDHFGDFAYESASSAIFNLGPGRYTFSSVGGTELGAFSGSLEVEPEFVWINREEVREITRGQTLTLRWTGGDPKQLVHIWGIGQGPGTLFICYADISAGEFTVPSNIVNHQVGGRGIDRVFLYTFGSGTRIQADGIDYLTLTHSWSTGGLVSFK